LLERFTEAKPLFQALLAANKSRPAELVARLAIIDARTGDRAAALRASDELAKRSTDYHQREFSYWRAHIMAQLGDTAQAIQLLRDAFAQGISPTTAHADMLLEPLHGNPDYEALVRPKG
jgi:tetratricopeptide (TPR) repeat protein